MTVTVPVCWWNENPEAIARGYWDHAMIEDLFSGGMWLPVQPLAFEHHLVGYDGPGSVYQPLTEALTGAVVVVPARHNATEERVANLTRFLDSFAWAFVILTGDEEGTFPWRWLRRPDARRTIWHMNGRPDPTDLPDRTLGSGYTPPARAVFAHLPTDVRDLDWFFAGQVTHRLRHECVDGLRTLGGLGRLLETEGFTQGEPQPEYLADMARAKAAPAPAGPVSRDSFRLYEALEAGAVPVTETDLDYWPCLFPTTPPWPMLDRWESACTTIPPLLHEWSRVAARTGAWWAAYKRDLVYELHDTIRGWLGSDLVYVPYTLADQITVIIPTSPIPSHPDTTILEQTVDSVRAHLPDCEIVLVADGVRPEQSAYADVYAEYLRRVTVLCARRWSNVLPVFLGEWGHQANATRRALTYVRTPLILFVEHDTPLTGPELWVDWQGLVGALRQGAVDMIRLHHETEIGEYHRSLMLDAPIVAGAEMEVTTGVRLQKTRQWSQRPHLSSVAFYTRILDAYFGNDGRTMIEDVMHGVVADYVDRFGERGWDQFRVAVYLPDTANIQRSWHTDGRAGDPKFGMKFSYDGRTAPEGAPSTRDESDRS